MNASGMRRLKERLPRRSALAQTGAALFLMAGAGLMLPPVQAASKSAARVIKVLPHYLDKEGRHALSPSLFDRDAYQFQLSRNPEQRGGLRFDVLWRVLPRAPTGLTLRVELRGTEAPAQAPVIVEAPAVSRGGYSQWTKIRLKDEDYDRLGEMIAWRVSLWRGDELLGEQKSFLW